MCNCWTTMTWVILRILVEGFEVMINVCSKKGGEEEGPFFQIVLVKITCWLQNTSKPLRCFWFRKFFHLSRFSWPVKKIQKPLKIGCHVKYNHFAKVVNDSILHSYLIGWDNLGQLLFPAHLSRKLLEPIRDNVNFFRAVMQFPTKINFSSWSDKLQLLQLTVLMPTVLSIWEPPPQGVALTHCPSRDFCNVSFSKVFSKKTLLHCIYSHFLCHETVFPNVA